MPVARPDFLLPRYRECRVDVRTVVHLLLLQVHREAIQAPVGYCENRRRENQNPGREPGTPSDRNVTHFPAPVVKEEAVDLSDRPIVGDGGQPAE